MGERDARSADSHRLVRPCLLFSCPPSSCLLLPKVPRETRVTHQGYAQTHKTGMDGRQCRGRRVTKGVRGRRRMRRERVARVLCCGTNCEQQSQHLNSEDLSLAIGYKRERSRSSALSHEVTSLVDTATASIIHFLCQSKTAALVCVSITILYTDDSPHNPLLTQSLSHQQNI